VIAGFLRSAVARSPDGVALRVLGASRVVLWAELQVLVEQRQLELQALGLEPGDWIALAAERTIAHAVELLAALCLGAVPVLGGPLSHHDQGGTNPMLVVYTSGSTGAAKPIPLMEVQIRASISASASRLGVRTTDAWLCALPLDHVGGVLILFRALSAGTCVVLAPGPFSPESLAAALSNGMGNQISLVPFQLQRMLPFLKERPPSADLRFILLGGGAASRTLLVECEHLGLPVARTWGMTECASQVATAKPGVFSGPLPPLPGVQVLRESGSGRLRIIGDIAPKGSFLSRDTGTSCELGVSLAGRVDNIVISGGENLSLDRIQNALLDHPEIADAVVIARSDSEWGERPVALCVAAGALRPKLKSIRAFLKKKGLRQREFPDFVQWVERVPRNALGKLIKSEIHWD
jgi:O-succinylbenzoic acid--CoA ligase